MADNTLLNPGNGGDLIASDDIGGIKFQRVKLVLGNDGVNDGDISSSNPIPSAIVSALPAGTNIIGALVANQSMNLNQFGGAAVTLGQKVMASSIPVVIASDQSAVFINGNVANAVADAGNPIKIGGIARTTANPASVANGQRVNASFDRLGRQIVVVGQIRDLILTQRVQIVNSTVETTILSSPGFTSFADVFSLILTNQSFIPVNVTIRDAVAGTIRMIISLAANGGAVINLSRPFPQATVNNNWTAQLSVNTVTVNIVTMAEHNTN